MNDELNEHIQRDSQRAIFWETTAILNENDLLPHVLVIGSWAEYLWEEANYIDGFISNLRTRDMDIMIRNLRKPRESIDITALLEARGYISDQSHSGIVRFQKDGMLELEFLVLEKGRGQVEPYDVPPLGIKAPGLRELGILDQNPVELQINGYIILVPSPQAYILHKMMIQRQTEYKAEKDAIAVGEIIESMKTNKSHMLALQFLYNELTPKQQRLIQAHCEKYQNPMLGLLDEVKKVSSTT